MTYENSASLQQVPAGPQVFTGPTTRDALNQVRRALGADAIILRQEESAQGVSVHASLELPDVITEALPERQSGLQAEIDKEIENEIEKEIRKETQTEAQAESQTHAERSAASAASDDGVTAEQNSRQASRFAADVRQVTVDDGVAAHLADETMTAGASMEAAELHEVLLQAGYGRHLIEDFPFARSLVEFRQQLIERLDFVGQGVVGLSGIYRFVGAAGSGKTSLLIKSLLTWVEQHGSSGVAVLSTDQAKLGATEGLLLACQMLDVDIYEVPPSGVTHTLAQLRGRQLVFIDTPALERNSAAAAIIDAEVQDVWVMSALHNLANVAAEISLHQRIPACIAVSHLDQLLSADAWLNHIYRLRLPLLCLGNTQQMRGVSGVTRQTVGSLFFARQNPTQQSVKHLTV